MDDIALLWMKIGTNLDNPSTLEWMIGSGLNNRQQKTRWIATGINSSKWMTRHSDNIWELWMILRLHGWKLWQFRITLPGWAIGDGSLCGEVCLHHITSYAWIGNHTRQRWWSHWWPLRMTAVSSKQIDQRWISTLCLFVSCIGKSQHLYDTILALALRTFIRSSAVSITQLTKQTKTETHYLWNLSTQHDKLCIGITTRRRCWVP